MGAPVEGTSGSVVTDDGRPPVKVGGVYKVTPATLADGQRYDIQLTSRGAQAVSLWANNSAVAISADALLDNEALLSTRLNVNNVAMLFNGSTYDRARVPNVFKIVAAVAITAGTGATIWTPAAGKKFRLMGYALSSSAAASLIFGDNLVGTVIFRSPLLGAAGIDGQNVLGNGIISAAANNVLKLDVSATSTITGTVWGTEE